MHRVDAADEKRHAIGPDAGWNESWCLDFVDPDRGVAGYVRLGLYPRSGRAWYWACLVGPGRPLVTVIDDDVPLPPGRSLEIRTEGLWADMTVETPLDHVTVGVEAFAVGVDDPAEVYGELRGDRVPLGFDLEWETDGGVYGDTDRGHYEVPCRVHGEALVGPERIELDGSGQRNHRWGGWDQWSTGWSATAGRLSDATRFHGVASEPSADLSPMSVVEAGYLQSQGGQMERVGQAAHHADLGQHGFPTSSRWQIGGLDLVAEPVAFSPVSVTAADGRETRLARAWCRFRTEDGRIGHGWTEWNQPVPGPRVSSRST